MTVESRLSNLEQFRDDFDSRVSDKLEPKLITLQAEIDKLRAELKDARQALEQAIGVAQTTAQEGVHGAKQAQATADTARQLVTPLAQSTVLKHFIAEVKWENSRRGKYFWFPNVAAWDIRATGQFYSARGFEQHSPFEEPQWDLA